MDIQLQHRKQQEKEEEEDAIREQKMRDREEQQKLIQEVLERKKKERKDQVDHMYKIGLDRMKREEKEDNTDALRNKHIENAEEKAYHQWEEQNKKRQQLQVTVDASRKALIQKRKNDREQEKSVDRTVADLIKMRNQELHGCQRSRGKQAEA